MLTERRLSLENTPFSLDHTLGCGQAFRWKKGKEAWEGVAGNRLIKIRQKGNTLFFTGAEEEFIRNYFQLDLDLESILSDINRDVHIGSAIERCYGLRILKQPEWECIASYICATNTNIPRIIGCIENLSVNYGRRIRSIKEEAYEFPYPENIASSSLCDLDKCRLGYRTRYLHDTAKQVLETPGLIPSIYELPYEKAKKRLMELKGVGPKAADCILLFAFNKYEAFPIDVWIRRIMSRYYISVETEEPISTKEYKKIGDFARGYFGPFAGYAQEYLFCNRNNM
jgi:N-glycosylase/DNA lyase